MAELPTSISGKQDENVLELSTSGPVKFGTVKIPKGLLGVTFKETKVEPIVDHKRNRDKERAEIPAGEKGSSKTESKRRPPTFVERAIGPYDKGDPTRSTCEQHCSEGCVPAKICCGESGYVNIICESVEEDVAPADHFTPCGREVKETLLIQRGRCK